MALEGRVLGGKLNDLAVVDETEYLGIVKFIDGSKVYLALVKGS